MNQHILNLIRNFVEIAPAAEARKVADCLLAAQSGTPINQVVSTAGSALHPDHFHLLRTLVDVACKDLSLRELGVAIAAMISAAETRQSETLAEIVWTGPETSQLGIRRNDQVLYDLILGAQREITLVTFSAAKIDLLRAALMEALGRGVSLRLILEFEEASAGQLTYDAAKAFGKELLSKSEVYYWPLEQRERNQAGKPGKLHAKCALIDDALLVSSANLTDDAFNRNMELGVLLRSYSHTELLRKHLAELVISGTIVRWTLS